ncbi:MAG: proliferating cell nuclear antigen (pcna) [Candidatus Bathyarchaeota archaeon]
MFEIELSRIDAFRNLIKALSVIVDEGTFNMDEAQVKLLAMDPSHVAMVDFELPNEFFDVYKCEGESRLTLNIGEFLKFLDRVNRDENVTINLDEDNTKLTILCKRGGHTRRFVMPVLEPLDEEVPQPKIFFKSSSRILTQSLRRAIRDASLVSEHVKVEVDAESFKISAKGDMGSSLSDWEKGSDELLELKAEEESSATFTLSYLQDIVRAVSASSEVAALELSTDMPIKMDFELPQGRLIYYLAPCIGV